MPTVLVSGAASGLGLVLVEAYSSRGDGVEVISIDRTPHSSPAPNVQTFAVDVSSEASVAHFAAAIQHRAIDLVVHSAGVRGLVPGVEAQQQQRQGDDVAACETLEAMDLSTLTTAFTVNAAGTFLLLRALLPNLRRASGPKVVVMSSRMGSIGNNESPNRAAGGSYAYRASKAAMNALLRSFAVDVPDVVFVACHPGRVETGLVKWREDGAITAHECMEALLPTIESWGKEHTGKFYDRFGTTIPW